MTRILILMSDTGGGHRAAAEAIRDALLIRQTDPLLEVEIVDALRDYAPPPWNRSSELYPVWISKGKRLWEIGYHFSNHRVQARLMQIHMTRRLKPGLRRLYADYPPDVVVNVHPLLTTAAFKALPSHPKRPAFITIVTDLVSTHAIWYERQADRTLVPTPPAFDRGLRLGMPADKMRVTGLPVNPQFAEGLLAKAEARKRLGWDAALPAVLMIGGGEGMGPLYALAKRIDSLAERCQIAVIAGRNAVLKQQLDEATWNQPAHIYPFVTNMPELMAAADILITKAGPATISEACMAGLPMILSDAIPGQEDGNVRYVVQNDAGLYANTPDKVQTAVADWLAHGPEFLRDRSEAARRLARPNAVWTIAAEVLALC